MIDVFGTNKIPIFIFISLSFIFLSSTLIDRESNAIEKSEPIKIRRLFTFKVNLFLIASFFMIMSHAVLYTFFSLWLKKVGYSNIEIGLVWSIGVIAEIIFFNQKKILSRFRNLTYFGFHVSFLQ